MDLAFLILADSAQVVGEKLYTLGAGWTALHPKELPVAHPCSVAVGLDVPWTETNQRQKFEVKLMDADGQQLGDEPLVAGEFEVGRPPGIPEGSSQRLMFAGPVKLLIPSSGQYEIVLSTGDDDIGVTSFAVAPVATPATA